MFQNIDFWMWWRHSIHEDTTTLDVALQVLHKLKRVIPLADGLAEEHWQLQAARIGRVSFLQESGSWWVVYHPVDVPVYIGTKETGLSGL